jgi:hypothetical protein
VSGLLSDIADTTCLPKSQVVVLAIVAGIGESSELPEDLVMLCKDELEAFGGFLRVSWQLGIVRY